ncbi:MAG: heme lyase CcmF/NrfE family subunit [Alphaproteobacteria bacterium]
MLPLNEIGHFALALALAVALAQSLVPLIGAARGDDRLMAVGRPAALAQFALIALAFVILTRAFVASDFSLAVVVENSHTLKPLLYKVSGVWGNHEGSMLLWVLILALYGGLVALFSRQAGERLVARALAVQGMVASGFLAFKLLTSNPFRRLVPAPVDGGDLNPLLQDPGLAFHPPLLYLGYVGLCMTFAFAVAGLIECRVDQAWARAMRPWALLAWSSLTLGIALGSWWAYYELGWGGWWFWDPVENASFMPWLFATALLHSVAVTATRDALKSWTVLLAVLAFGLALVGTFLVRSGVLSSVHAFASDPGRGLFILGLIAAAVGGALVLFAVRGPALRARSAFDPVSREGALVLNNLLLAVGALTVFVGTLWPLLMDAVGGPKVSVGAPYFNATFVPLMVPLLIALPFGPLLAWRRGDLLRAASRLRLAFAAAIAAAALSLWLAGLNPWPVIGMTLAVWLAAGVLSELGERTALGRLPLAQSLARARGLPGRAWGMSLAHFGLALFVAGVTASSAWESESIQVMRPGESVVVAGYTFRFDGARQVPGPNYVAERGTITVLRDGQPYARMAPERRFYPVARDTTTEAAIHTTWLADLYAVIGESDGAGGHTIRLHHNPLVPWIWLGTSVMALGGMVSLASRRRQPQPRTQPHTQPQAPATAVAPRTANT